MKYTADELYRLTDIMDELYVGIVPRSKFPENTAEDAIRHQKEFWTKGTFRSFMGISLHGRNTDDALSDFFKELDRDKDVKGTLKDFEEMSFIKTLNDMPLYLNKDEDETIYKAIAQWRLSIGK